LFFRWWIINFDSIKMHGTNVKIVGHVFIGYFIVSLSCRAVRFLAILSLCCLPCSTSIASWYKKILVYFIKRSKHLYPFYVVCQTYACRRLCLSHRSDICHLSAHMFGCINTVVRMDKQVCIVAVLLTNQK